MERKNVRVLKGRGDVDFAGESFGAEDGRELGLEQLDRDPPVVLPIFGEKNDRHAPLT